MPCTYFLVFLLSLLSLYALATAEQHGRVAALDDRALTGRFCLRGPRSKFLNHPPQSTEKYIEKTSYVDAAAQETVEQEKMSYDDEEGNPTAKKVAVKNSKESRFEDKASDYVKMTEKPEKMSEDDDEGNSTTGKVAVKNSKESRFEDKASDYVKMSVKKTEEANKYKPAAGAPSEAKRSNFYDFEDIN